MRATFFYTSIARRESLSSIEGGYRRLQWVSRGFKGSQGVSKCFEEFLERFLRVSRGFYRFLGVSRFLSLSLSSYIERRESLSLSLSLSLFLSLYIGEREREV